MRSSHFHYLTRRLKGHHPAIINTMPDPRIYLDMALPVVKTLRECADWSKTVAPYLPQLYDLPYKVATHITDVHALRELYASTNPLMTALAFAVFFVTPVVLAVAEFNKNYSQVDRLWSMLPVIYNVHYTVWAHVNGLPTSRLDHVMAVSLIWGARLTYNYWRKGGYTVGSEDYRWAIVKDYVGPVGMFIFDVTFISLGQNVSYRLGAPRTSTNVCRSSSGSSPRQPTFSFSAHESLAMSSPLGTRSSGAPWSSSS
jgi:hypothetical protein